MWAIFESKDVQKTLPRLPTHLRERYEAWKAVVRVDGPRGLSQVRGFHDEALRGHWQGYRSSRLSAQYRVVYFVAGSEVAVRVERVTPHDHRR